MSSHIIADIEKGVVALIHELPEPPTDPTQIPDHLVPAVMTFAERLGLEAEKITGGEAGVLFDLIGHAVEGVSAAQEGAGHAQAGSAATNGGEAAGTAEAAAHAPETEVSADNPHGIAGEAAGEAGAAEQAQGEQPAAGQGGEADHSADIDAAIAKAKSEWGGEGVAPAA